MREHKLLILFIAFVAYFTPSLTGAEYTPEIDSLFMKLDSMIADNSSFLSAKETRVDEVKAKLQHATDKQERYSVLRQIYDEYCTFDSDSAIYYARMARDLAVELNEEEAREEWGIKLAFVYSACGLFPEASREVEGLYGSRLSESLRPEYYNTMEYLYSHYGVYTDEDPKMAAEYRQKAALYKDSLGMEIREGHPYYLWYQVSVDPLNAPKETLNRLAEVVDRSKLNNRNDAINAYWTSRAYSDRGMQNEALRYIIYSAMADVRIVNRDIASLQEIATYLYNQGDIVRAYEYMNYCIDQAHYYHNRIRMVSISTFSESVRAAYLNQLKQKDARVRTSLIVVVVLLVLVLALVGYMIKQYRNLRRSREELAKVNAALQSHMEELNAVHKELSDAHEQEKALNNELKKANNELHEAGAIKEEYIGYAFTLSTDFINDLDDLRKKLLRKVKTRQLGELVDMLESESLVQGELHRFYRSFDETFIHIFPNFLEEYNADQEPQDRIELKEGELLNTRLRIYALHRLGITESAKIAKMLRCSIQTVYNNRPRKKK